jgi:hypothetical protein
MDLVTWLLVRSQVSSTHSCISTVVNETRRHNIEPLDTILSYFNAIHISENYSLKIRFNTLLPTTPRFLSATFPHEVFQQQNGALSSSACANHRNLTWSDHPTLSCTDQGVLWRLDFLRGKLSTIPSHKCSP